MAMFSLSPVPRRCVNLPGSSLLTICGSALRGRVREGPQREQFAQEFARWLGAAHAFGTASGRSAFALALQALALPRGSEILFPVFTFPVMPMVAEMLGHRATFCPVDPETFNAGPEQIEPLLTPRTAAVLATHMFGRPCPIEPIAELTRARGIRLLEDCAHALGVRVRGKQVGTFGDVGVFSFAEGKNMPCCGGGAIAVSDPELAARARQLHAAAPIPAAGRLFRDAVSVWIKWLVTRPAVFGLTAYPVLRWKQRAGGPLMDSSVGDDLLEEFRATSPRVTRLSNLQSAIGLRQLRAIDAFNAGAKRNATLLTQELQGVPGIRIPPVDGDHIYVYYPLGVDPAVREDLRHFLLQRGIDSKHSDMADCTQLDAFRRESAPAVASGTPQTRPAAEDSLLEICVYPTITERQVRRIAAAVRAFAATRPAPANGRLRPGAPADEHAA